MFFLLYYILMNGCFGLVTGLKFTSPMSPGCIEMMKFHKTLMSFLVFILVLVGGILLVFRIKYAMNSGSSLDFLEKKNLEFLWTLLPTMFLIFVGIFSLKILYHLDMATMRARRRSSNIKVMGRQWNWKYKYFTKMTTHSKNWSYDSFMLHDTNLRILECDKPLMMKLWSLSTISTTSSDVMHSFSVPELGLKLDAVPGRLKEVKQFLLRSGIYYGQCSELCGVNHSFMPMKMECFPFW